MQVSMSMAAKMGPSSARIEETAAARDSHLDPKLVTAAHQFEASLMQELLKPLSSDPVFGEEEQAGNEAGLSSLSSSAEGSGSALTSFGSEALAKALSEKGGLGIARRILDHFEASAGPAKESRVQSSEIQDGRAIHY